MTTEAAFSAAAASEAVVAGRTDVDAEEAEEGLRLLLGGLDVSDVPQSAWDCIEKDYEEEDVIKAVVDDDISNNDRQQPAPPLPNKKVFPHRADEASSKDEDEHVCYALAHAPPHSDGRHPAAMGPLHSRVRVVDTPKEDGRGKGLIATAFIPRGSVIFTERAAVATQQQLSLPPPTECAANDHKCLYGVLGCQNCFRSLEPASRLSGIAKNDVERQLPRPDLWPVPPLCFSDEVLDAKMPNSGVVMQLDKFGRVQCCCCGATFCSERCYEGLRRQLGSCCACSEVQRALPTLLTPARNVAETDEENENREVQPAVELAIRMFGYSLHAYRRAAFAGSESTSNFLFGLCGEASDLDALEIGQVCLENGAHGCHRTLQEVYDKMASVWVMSEVEMEVLNLDYFHKLVAVAARNGVGLATQSPFTVYYESLLRATGGRGSDRHEDIKSRVASALGSDLGKLERGMDHLVNKLVAVEIVAIFPLTARINHSCRPNAQIRGQAFVDCHADVVALRDIDPYEEITISYIPTGRGVGIKSTYRRRRELSARYLFRCTCEECGA